MNQVFENEQEQLGNIIEQRLPESQYTDEDKPYFEKKVTEIFTELFGGDNI